jgi:membrane protein DedA with SNARE-associated domain
MDFVLEKLHYYFQNSFLDGSWIVFVLALLESLPFIGALVPGTIIIVFVGFLAYVLNLNLGLVIIGAVLGAVVGDIIGFYFGRVKKKEYVWAHKFIFKYLYIPEAGRFLLDKGGLSVVLGRLLGPTRAFVPFYMGREGEKEDRFWFYDILGAIIWAVFYVMLGYLFGTSYELLKMYLHGFEMFVVLLMILIIGPFVLTKIFKKKIM